jgi:integrase/recombinase XerD
MANVNCTVYFRENGTSKMYSVGQSKGREGSYGIRWYEGKRQRQKIVGEYSAATAAKLRKELELKKAASPKANLIVLAQGSTTLDVAIETFVREREDLNPTSARRWKIELDLFEQEVGKTFLSELTREDVFTYRKWYKEHGRSDNTIALRTSSLFTFGMRFNVLCNLFTKNERKRLTLRTDGPVDYYTENDPYELKKFFAACDDEQRLCYMFFLHTGAREREVSYAMFRDLDLQHRTFRIEEKAYSGKKFTTKNRQGRTVPIPQVLADALETWRVMCGERQLVLTNGDGGPEGHFLYKLKEIALKAGLNCGNCVTGSYDDFFNIIPGTEKYCKDSPCCEHWTLHKFRRTWATLHLWNGVPITTLQAWIGHSDLTTLNRYVAHINAKSEMARQMTDNLAKMTLVQGGIFAEAVAATVEI